MINANDDYILILLIELHGYLWHHASVDIQCNIEGKKGALEIIKLVKFEFCQFLTGWLTKQLSLSVCQFLHI